MKTLIVAIDPGASGGIAYQQHGHPANVVPMPPTEGDLEILFRTMVTDPASTTAYVEEVGGFVGTPQPGSAMFKFGGNFGFLLGALPNLGVRVQLIRPQRWQKALSLGNARDCPDKTAWKNRLKAHAQRLFPYFRPTLKTADALLILEFGIQREAVAHPAETVK